MINKYCYTLILAIISMHFYGQTNTEPIEKVIDQWHLAAAQADFEAYFSMMTSEAVFIGTDAGENWQLQSFREFSKPYFDKGKAWSFTAVERNVYIDKSKRLAWFDELLDTRMGICRGSGVVMLEDSNWKIAHYVLSATIPNDDMQEVIRIKKEKDSVQLFEIGKRKTIQKNK
ncbi:MAG: nuclear transport factor 2 family protein [Flavobacteriaceae bacterium]